eukprot:6490097-Amphidinium_carterae.1
MHEEYPGIEVHSNKPIWIFPPDVAPGNGGNDEASPRPEMKITMRIAMWQLRLALRFVECANLLAFRFTGLIAAIVCIIGFFLGACGIAAVCYVRRSRTPNNRADASAQEAPEPNSVPHQEAAQQTTDTAPAGPPEAHEPPPPSTSSADDTRTGEPPQHTGRQQFGTPIPEDVQGEQPARPPESSMPQPPSRSSADDTSMGEPTQHTGRQQLGTVTVPPVPARQVDTERLAFRPAQQDEIHCLEAFFAGSNFRVVHAWSRNMEHSDPVRKQYEARVKIIERSM